jgi:hypothetical protein
MKKCCHNVAWRVMQQRLCLETTVAMLAYLRKADSVLHPHVIHHPSLALQLT